MRVERLLCNKKLKVGLKINDDDILFLLLVNVCSHRAEPGNAVPISSDICLLAN